jgi:hypothetical protein
MYFSRHCTSRMHMHERYLGRVGDGCWGSAGSSVPRFLPIAVATAPKHLGPLPLSSTIVVVPRSHPPSALAAAACNKGLAAKSKLHIKLFSTAGGVVHIWVQISKFEVNSSVVSEAYHNYYVDSLMHCHVVLGQIACEFLVDLCSGLERFIRVNVCTLNGLGH